ncbi:MAG: Nif3-like dinuclear metal center hexameric protein [Planctomycetota bacterium]
MKLPQVVAALQDLAPLEWAEEWDNVGLLLEPFGRRSVRRVLLTIDLTSAVVAEARDSKAELVVAYHPPIFAPLRRLTQAAAGERNVLACVAAKIAVYSPHTALDAAPGGVNDWLADGLGAGAREGLLPRGDEDSGAAQGRRVTLARPVRLGALVRRIKQHLGLSSVRVAKSARHDDGEPVRDVALCAGAGGSVIGGVPADVHWTGEMRHHDVLAALERGTSVVLCEHTNTERGYLPRLRERLRERLGGVDVALAKADAEPLTGA